jgi:hypothetical protein
MVGPSEDGLEKGELKVDAFEVQDPDKPSAGWMRIPVYERLDPMLDRYQPRLANNQEFFLMRVYVGRMLNNFLEQSRRQVTSESDSRRKHLFTIVGLTNSKRCNTWTRIPS